ncbi:MAG: quinolinate synthase [Rhodospirillaceae bacterium]|jgi:quinolinate synthase|nr:quinolinate synthase [Rhodospirillaceae bacterium]|tara:strand:- start:181 stop:1194 length:1014 start_codon:yes stop_codon:yes gene_type:complete
METIILPDAQALKETDLDPSLDPWAEIDRLRREKNAVILAHYYQDGEIQDLADFVGDSLDLSRRAAATGADMIVFSGVRFMAEVAKILSPEKTVVLPDADAGCSLEETCPPDDFARFRAAHPDHIAITYINCSAEVKALSDIIITSSNAEHIINQLPERQPILFAPDKHLGTYLARKTGREMVLWDGTCIVHDQFSARELVKLKTNHPDAPIAAHPECHQGILDHADHIGSTRSILDYVIAAPEREFIIATERHIIHQMEKAAPEKTFIAAPGSDGSCNCADCPFMELNTLEKIYLAMVNGAPRVEISEDLRLSALKPLEKMLEMSPPARSVPQAAE